MTLWLVLSLGLFLGVSGQDYFELGPYAVNFTSISSALTFNQDKNLDVYAPNAPGDFPVYYLVVGLGGIVPGALYSYYLTHLASHGIIGIAVWKIENPINSFNASWWDETIEFVENRLENNLHNKGWDSEMHVDSSNSFISGHSAGAHGAVAKLLEECNSFKGMILHSPVDGADPWGIIDKFVIEPGQKVNFSLPTYIVINEQDPWPGMEGAPNGCVPPELGDFRFFDAMSGPVWMVNTTGFGHVDFMDEEIVGSIEVLPICYIDPLSEKQEYREFVAGSSVSFIKAVLDMANNCDGLINLETPEIHGVTMANHFEANGWERCSQTTCRNL